MVKTGSISPSFLFSDHLEEKLKDVIMALIYKSIEYYYIYHKATEIRQFSNLGGPILYMLGKEAPAMTSSCKIQIMGVISWFINQLIFGGPVFLYGKFTETFKGNPSQPS